MNGRNRPDPLGGAQNRKLLPIPHDRGAGSFSRGVAGPESHTRPGLSVGKCFSRVGSGAPGRRPPATRPAAAAEADRKSGVWGKVGAVLVDSGGCRHMNKKKYKQILTDER